MSNLKTIKVKSFFDVPKNFTGIIKSDLNIPKNFTGIVKYPNGTKMWFKDGKLYREDGPAIMWNNSNKEYWLNGIYLTEEHHKIIMMFSEESRQKLYENDNLGLKNLLEI